MTDIGRNYGLALYTLAKEEALEETILRQLTVLSEGIAQEPDFIKLLHSHNLTKQERYDIIDASFRESCHSYVINFWKLLVEKGYVKHFGECCEAYRNQYNQDHGILPVRAVTAAPLTGEQANRLTEKLSQLTGKTVQLTNRIDPNCLGGIRLDYDGKQLDDTVAHRLERIRALLNT